MSKVKVVFSVFIAMLALSALTSASASAVWMVNGTNLTSSAALATTAQVDKKGVLEGGTLNIECKGNLKGTSPEIKSGNIGVASSLIFTECTTTNAHCSIPTTLGTVPISAEAVLSGALAVKATFKPKTGTIFATILYSGEECAVSGQKAVTGDVETNAPTGQDERTDQILEVNQAATGLLKIASSAASLTGSVLILVASRQAWSFL